MPPTYPRRHTCPERKRKQSRATIPNTRQRWLTAERSEPSGRMRGIEPYNKIIVVFPSSVLPSRCYGNPPSPEGEGLIGCVHDCHLGALVEKSPARETARCIYAPARSPGKKTKTIARDYFKYLPARLRAETPCVGNENNRTQTNSFSAGDFSAAFGLSSSLRSK